jgi:hypothetical protein
MKTIHILYAGKNREILDTVVRLINGHEEWMGKGVESIAEAKECLEQSEVDIVLLGCGIDEAEEAAFRNYMADGFPVVRIIQHYGGGSGLLSNEILEALHASGSSQS